MLGSLELKCSLVALQNNITNFNLDHQNQEIIGTSLISMIIVSGMAKA